MSMPKFSPTGAAAGSAVGGLISPWSNPYNKSMDYLNQIPGTVTPYYNPYIQAGGRSLNTLENTYNQLLQNPGQTMNQIGSGFQASPGYQYNVEQATNAANQAAAAGGMLGTPEEQQQLAGTVSGLANQDYYNYLNNALGLYGQGLSGMQGINQMGYNASDQLARTLKDVLESQSKASMAQQYAENQRSAAESSGFGDVLGGFAGGFLGF